MAKLINLKTFTDNRGNLTVIEDKELPFPIRRVFYIYGVDDSVRGGHRHKTTRQALVCIQGGCTVYSTDGHLEETFDLKTPQECLLVEREDWHKMYNFTPDCILQVFASEWFDHDDYIFEEYPRAL